MNDSDTDPLERGTTSDEQTTTDRPIDSTGTTDTADVSRRGTLTALALGVLGIGSSATASAEYPKSRTALGEEGVEIDGETVFELTGPRTFSRDDGARLRDGGTLRAGSLNEIADAVVGATISGGGLRREDRDTTDPNRVTANFGTVSGGAGNRAGGDDPGSGQFSTVSGGLRNTASGALSAVSGGARNEATGQRSVVAGGRRNEATGDHALVGGGIGNEATDRYGTVTGGTGNAATGRSSTVVGGQVNIASGQHSTVVGGRGNVTESRGATVAGGIDNDATATGAFAAGGESNTADGAYSFVAGRNASADDNEGAVVFGDASEESIGAEEENAAYFQMPVNAQSFNNTSTVASKQNIDPVDPESVLEDVESLDVATWEYRRNDEGTHMGPTAEEFHDTFELGEDDQTISTVDADGVALAAIQGLSKRLERKVERIEKLKAEQEEKDKRIDELETKQERKDERIDELEARLSALEEEVN